MELKYFLFFTFMIATIPCKAQEFRLIATIVEKESKGRVSDAELMISGLNSDFSIYLNSDMNGMVSALLKGNQVYRIIASSEEYRNQKIILDGTGIEHHKMINISIEMSPKDSVEPDSVVHFSISNIPDSLSLNTPVDPSKDVQPTNTLELDQVSKPAAVRSVSTEINKEQGISYQLDDHFTGYSIVIKSSQIYLPKTHGIFVNNKNVKVFETSNRSILYMIGEFASLEEATLKLNNQIKSRYPEAYILHFKNGFLEK